MTRSIAQQIPRAISKPTNKPQPKIEVILPSDLLRDRQAF